MTYGIDGVGAIATAIVTGLCDGVQQARVFDGVESGLNRGVEPLAGR